MEESCCVGKIVESPCNLQHYSSIAESIPLCDLTLDEQRVIKLRVKSENISFICRHHLFVFLTYYDRIWKKSLCCDPYSKHGNKSVKGDKTISLELSDKIICATNSVMRLIPGEKICPRCNKLLNEVIERGYLTPEKIRPQLSHENNDADEELFESPTTIGNTPSRHLVSVLSEASVITPVSDLSKCNRKRRLQICEKVLNKVRRKMLPETPDPEIFLASDFENLMTSIREKVYLLN
jgi:hypothetical protein